jgi:WD40 repeat protein
MMGAPFKTLEANMGAIRSLRFSSDGRFLIAAEPADFVHIYDARTNYQVSQELDFFGEISGVSLTPDDETLFVGNADTAVGSIMEWQRRPRYLAEDCLV